MRFLSLIPLLLLALLLPALAQQSDSIQDNSFLIEESYNQEPAVVQEISLFSWSNLTHSWVYTFTNEWPINGLKHQFSYTIAATHAGGSPGMGLGDTALNYRYQLVGSGETRVAISPRLSLLIPSGDSRYARGLGGTGLQTNLPLSLVLHPKLVTHFNAGATWIPRAKNILGDRAALTGYNVGQSFVYLAKPRFNLMLETVYNDMESVAAPGKTVRQKNLFVSPGIRWAYNFKSGLQIVPGIAAPLGVGPSSGDKGLIVYLSFEQPLKLLAWQKKD
ncbi:MAG TPA: hypothetical protein VFU86_10275 [Terriglobales bacterium]|nr:hypothetical protein [Terriglobales bacterium]